MNKQIDLFEEPPSDTATYKKKGHRKSASTGKTPFPGSTLPGSQLELLAQEKITPNEKRFNTKKNYGITQKLLKVIGNTPSGVSTLKSIYHTLTEKIQYLNHDIATRSTETEIMAYLVGDRDPKIKKAAERMKSDTLDRQFETLFPMLYTTGFNTPGIGNLKKSPKYNSLPQGQNDYKQRLSDVPDSTREAIVKLIRQKRKEYAWYPGEDQGRRYKTPKKQKELQVNALAREIQHLVKTQYEHNIQYEKKRNALMIPPD